MLLDLLGQQLGGSEISKVSQALGVDTGSASKTIAAALPLLLGALAKNSKSSEGAAALAQAVENDHDGSALDDLNAVISNPEAGSGAGILKHVLGSRKSSVEAALGQVGGMDQSSVSRLLMMLAPLVMGGVGRVKRQQGLDAGGLANLLNGERSRIDSSSGGLLNLLDSDGDGSVADDVAELGKKLLGGFLK